MAIITHKDCRALNHAWDRQEEGPPEWRRPATPLWAGARYVVHLQCLRCKSWKHLAMTARGARIRSSYTYVDDYLMPKGEPRVNRDRMRLWLAVPSKVK